MYALCGVVAPVFWVVMISIEHALIPRFNWVTQQTSDAMTGWTKYATFSIVCFVVGLVLFIAFISFGQLGSPALGVLQSAFGVPLLVWLEVMALRLFRLP
jgi:hypothetical protein